MQLGTPDIISKSQRERLIMPNIAFMFVVRLFAYYRSIYLNVKPKNKYLS